MDAEETKELVVELIVKGSNPPILLRVTCQSNKTVKCLLSMIEDSVCDNIKRELTQQKIDIKSLNQIGILDKDMNEVFEIDDCELLEDIICDDNDDDDESDVLLYIMNSDMNEAQIPKSNPAFNNIEHVLIPHLLPQYEPNSRENNNNNNNNNSNSSNNRENKIRIFQNKSNNNDNKFLDCDYREGKLSYSREKCEVYPGWFALQYVGEKWEESVALTLITQLALMHKCQSMIIWGFKNLSVWDNKVEISTRAHLIGNGFNINECNKIIDVATKLTKSKVLEWIETTPWLPVKQTNKPMKKKRKKRIVHNNNNNKNNKNNNNNNEGSNGSTHDNNEECKDNHQSTELSSTLGFYACKHTNFEYKSGHFCPECDSMDNEMSDSDNENGNENENDRINDASSKSEKNIQIHLFPIRLWMIFIFCTILDAAHNCDNLETREKAQHFGQTIGLSDESTTFILNLFEQEKRLLETLELLF